MSQTQPRLKRQQYLIPDPSVRKVRRLSKQAKVSAGEIVRRAIESYDLDATHVRIGDADIATVLASTEAMLRETAERLIRINARLDDTQRRIESGELRREAETTMRQWLERNPGAVADFQAFLRGTEGRA